MGTIWIFFRIFSTKTTFQKDFLDFFFSTEKGFLYFVCQFYSIYLSDRVDYFSRKRIVIGNYSDEDPLV